ncbi:MAG: hypothetical protein VB858_22295 [Planctomycetaceae bacterium]
MDFVTDELFDDRRIRLLKMADYCTRKRPGIVVGQRLRGSNGVDALTRIGFGRS